LITKEQLSPEEISGRYDTVSHQTIYNWIYRMNDISLKRKIIKNLRREGKAYRKASKLSVFGSKIAPKTIFDQRPDVINKRESIGEFE
jgi:IS30 family transposase